MDETHKRNNSSNKTLKVINVESFYNYRTVGERFELFTSILSNNDNLIPMNIKTHGTKTNAYVVIPEKRAPPIDTGTNNIHAKKIRINGCFAQINQLNNRAGNPLINNFTLKRNQLIERVEEAEENDRNRQAEYFEYFSNSAEIPRELVPRAIPDHHPENCRTRRTAKKLACIDCPVQVCSFSADALVNLSGDSLQAELKAHGHPSTKQINGRARNKEETLRELLDHYIAYHNQNEPCEFYERIDEEED